MKAQYGALSPNLGGLGELILRLQRELFVVGAELATNPDASDRQQDGATRVSGEMVDGLDDAAARDRGRHRAAARVRRPRRDAAERRARGRPDGHPPRRAPDGDPRGRRRGLSPTAIILPYLNRLADLLWILARVAEQAEAKRRPWPGPRGLAADRTRRHPRGATPMTGQPAVRGHRPTQSPSQLGVRPAPALVQQLLVGAFGWMFAGLLLTAGVAYLVGGSEQILATVGQYWFLIAIGQFALAIAIQGAINRISPDGAPRPVLRLRRVDGLHDRADRQLLHDRVRRLGVLLARRRCSAPRRSTAPSRSGSSRGSAASCSWA